MKIVIAIIGLFFSYIVSSQSLTGKWRPVFVYIDSVARGDVKADTVFFSKVIKENVKDDENPEQSEGLIRFAMKLMMKKAKETQEEYFADGKYEETNTRTGRKKTGTYIFNKSTSALEKITPPLDKKESFVVSWRNGQLVLMMEMESDNGKKGKLKVVYEKL